MYYSTKKYKVVFWQEPLKDSKYTLAIGAGRMDMRATIKDVAKETGLSLGTISKYINGIQVREENRIKIEEAMTKLNYVRNNQARGLRTNRSYRIGIVWDFPGNQYESDVIQRIEERLRQEQYSVIISFHRQDIERARDIFQSLAQNRVDGILVKPMAGMQSILSKMQQAGITIIEADGAYAFGITDRIMSNVMQGIYQSGAYLIEEGHRRLALLGAGKKDDFQARDRQKGYKRVLEDYELPFYEEYMPYVGTNFVAGYAGMEKLWGLEKRPTGIIFASYNVCLGAISYLHQQKVRLPQELSIVVYDDLEFSLLSRPKLSAIARPVDVFVERIIDLLLRRLEGDREDFPLNIRLMPQLIQRESVRKLINE